MAHALDFTTGKAGIAYVGTTPWHGLGQQLQPGAELLTWQQQAGLDWEARSAVVQYQRQTIGMCGESLSERCEAKDNVVLYRSDTGSPLSIVSNRYKPVQPREVIEFYRDLTERHGFTLETAGALKDGKKIWALANTNESMQLRGNDIVRGYLLLATSFDGSMATQARFTSIRVVCNNTLSFAANTGKADVTVPHSATFDADKVKLDLNIGDAWSKFSSTAHAMAQHTVSKEESTRFFLDVYYGLDSEDKIREFRAKDGADKTAEKFFARMTSALFNSPGAHLESARGTLWGLVNAVTRDVDFGMPARSQENRLNSAWFGKGNSIKQAAMDKALAMIE